MSKPRFSFVHPHGDHRRPVHSHVMLQLLGINGKLPVDGKSSQPLLALDHETGQEVEVSVWVIPLVYPRQRTSTGRVLKRSDHRVLCECPGCREIVSAGRLFQHVCRPVDVALAVDDRYGNQDAQPLKQLGDDE